MFYVTREASEMKRQKKRGEMYFLWKVRKKCDWKAKGCDLVVINWWEFNKAYLFLVFEYKAGPFSSEGLMGYF
jgi:hypothetical protein